MRPRCAQDDPRHQNSPKTPQDASKTLPRRPKTCPRRPNIDLLSFYKGKTIKRTALPVPYRVRFMWRGFLSSKTPPRRTLFFIIFRCRFGSIFDRSWLGFPSQLASPNPSKSMKNRSKINENLKPKLGCLLASIFHRFWQVLGAKLGRKTEPRATKNRSLRPKKKS